MHSRRYVSQKIADTLSIDRKTIYRYLVNIRKSLEVHNSIEILYLITNKIKFKPQNIKLTPRGKEVFQFILKGLSDREIGECLNINYSGVRRHKEKMLFASEYESILELISKYYTNCTGESSD
uniref:helix-turn-helix transcriptional regulator n=1 Tax=uncultured Bilophila sp. TaxID=529385 RepID=UPI00345B9D12